MNPANARHWRAGAGRRGQLFSGDIAVASLVFLASLSMALFLWSSVNEDIRRAERLETMGRLANSAVEQLIRTPGIPEDWTESTVLVPGLSTEDRAINATKAERFISLMNATGGSSSYNDNRHMMGLGTYDFHLNATYLNGSIVRVAGSEFEAGLELREVEEGAAVDRSAIFNESIVRLNFIIWR